MWYGMIMSRIPMYTEETYHNLKHTIAQYYHLHLYNSWHVWDSVGQVLSQWPDFVVAVRTLVFYRHIFYCLGYNET